MGEPANRPGSSPGDSDLSRTYMLVLLVEALVVVALYGLGRYFG